MNKNEYLDFNVFKYDDDISILGLEPSVYETIFKGHEVKKAITLVAGIQYYLLTREIPEFASKYAKLIEAYCRKRIENLDNRKPKVKVEKRNTKQVKVLPTVAPVIENKSVPKNDDIPMVYTEKELEEMKNKELCIAESETFLPF